MTKKIAKKAFKLFLRNKDNENNKLVFVITKEEQKQLIEAAAKLHSKMAL
jgi:O-acetyl-ADP-ribose deacetylase (regulator of RNase III)